MQVKSIDDEKIAKENERTKQSHFLKTLFDLELDFWRK